jgi:valyl-tRNA synthetase
VPEKYRGLDRYIAREAVLADLRSAGLLRAEKPHKMVVPRCGRSGEVNEPMLTDQWFVAMNKPAPASHAFLSGKSFKDICLQAVNDGLATTEPQKFDPIRFIPDHWTSTYNHWLENVHDWCISRQLWWTPDSRVVRRGRTTSSWRATSEEACGNPASRQALRSGRTPTSCDTWFSSALWICHSTLGWPERRASWKCSCPARCSSPASTSYLSGSCA